MVDEPLHTTPEIGMASRILCIQRVGSEQRHYPNQRAHAQQLVPALAHSKIVVIEPVCVVPQSCSVVMVDSVRNKQKVFEKLARDIVVCAVMRRKLERDLEHVEAVHR